MEPNNKVYKKEDFKWTPEELKEIIKEVFEEGKKKPKKSRWITLWSGKGRIV
jgi:hypothetical protein